MASNSMSLTDVTIVTRLDSNPTFYFPQWNREVHALARSLFIEYEYEQGLYEMGQVSTIAEWAIAHPQQEDEEGVVIPVPNRFNVQPPPVLVNAPTHPQIAAYDMRIKKYGAFRASIRHLKFAILSTIGDSIKNDLFGDHIELGNMAIYDMIERLFLAFGQHTGYDLDLLYKAINKKLVKLSDFYNHTSKLSLAFQDFNSMEQPISEFDKLRYLKETTSIFPEIQRFIFKYEQKYLIVRQRSFQLCVQYLKDVLPEIMKRSATATATAKSEGYVAHVEDTITSSVPSPDYSEIIAAITPALIAAINGTSQVAAPPKLKPSKNQPYCFKHGYCAHSGADCNYEDLTADQRLIKVPAGEVDGKKPSTKVGKWTPKAK